MKNCLSLKQVEQKDGCSSYFGWSLRGKSLRFMRKFRWKRRKRLQGRNSFLVPLYFPSSSFSSFSFSFFFLLLLPFFFLFSRGHATLHLAVVVGISIRRVWVLRIAKVGYFFSPSLPNVEWSILGPLPFLFYQKSFIFRCLENCFWGPNLHNAVG